MLRYRRLVDAKDGHDLVHRVLAPRQQQQDLPPPRLCYCIERIRGCRRSSHDEIKYMPIWEYVKQIFSMLPPHGNESVCSALRNQLRFPRMKTLRFLMPAILSFAFPFLSAQSPTQNPDPLAPTQD